MFSNDENSQNNNNSDNNSNKNDIIILDENKNKQNPNSSQNNNQVENKRKNNEIQIDEKQNQNTEHNILTIRNLDEGGMKIDNFAENNVNIRNIINNALFSQLSEINVKLLD